MKALRTVLLAAGTCAFATSVSAADYLFTLSQGRINPFLNEPPTLPVGQLLTIYLHYVRSDIDGMGAFESGFDFFEGSGGEQLVVATNLNPVATFANVGTLTDVIFAMQGCQFAPNWIANFFVFPNGTGVRACFRPTVAGLPGGSEVMWAWDCQFPSSGHDFDFIGFDSTGSMPCASETPVSIEASSWGGIKSLYRR